MNARYQAVLWMIGWSFTFSCSMIANKWARAGLSLPMLIWARSAFGLIFLLPFLRSRWTVKHLSLQIFRGLLISLAMTCSYTAYRHLPTHTAAVLGTSGPLFQVILSILVLKEVVSWKRWGLLALGYLGVIIIMGPTRLLTSKYEFFSLAGNVAAAGSILAARALAQRQEPRAPSLFYGALIPFLVFSGGIPFFWSTPHGAQWGLLAFIGLCGALSQLFMFSALQKAPASFTAPFEYVRLCMMTLLGWIIFHENPSLNFYIGTPLLILSLAWLTRLNKS